ncbi:hypothetical protein ACGFI9_01500 [Micromonospora sp. NPDC048930]|uniref:hypothetical protein n=1 Tax=Micromonospora sp. NPDC048930 TaxID=3364261 RepID=UPI00371C4832
MIYVSWTDPESGRRERRTFATADGTGKLHRWLKREGIPFQSGWVVDAQAVATAREGAPWRPDPRVWASFRRPEGDAA